jgi:iron(III) transport system substrate-binding protein
METPRPGPTRRRVIEGMVGGVLAAGTPSRGFAAPPSASAISPDLIAAAKREGEIVFVTAADVLLAQRIANAFEAKFPGIKVRAERNGSERIFQRLDQEYRNNIHSVDVVDSADASHFIVWKRQGWLAPYVPEDVARHWPAEERDPDGMFQTFRASLSIMGVNTKIVKLADAPKSFADLLDPRWKGKLVKAHPSYSGTIVTTTFLYVREMGWGFLEGLAKQRVMQVQSATEPAKKIAQGERPVMVEGSDYVLYDLNDKGQPVEPIYPAEGTPLIPVPSAVLAKAPHPNAARLFQSWLYTEEAQQMLVDVGNTHSMHPRAVDRPGRKPLPEIKLWRADPAQILEQIEEIRRKYAEIFGT